MKAPISFPIAGLYYHYKPDMSDKMSGYIKADFNNPHDTNAIGVYSDDYGLIGYIPKDETPFVRSWAGTNSPHFKCRINLAVEPEWDRYFGTVYIFDTPAKSYLDNPFKDSSVYLCKNRFSLSGAQGVIESLGIEVTDRLSKNTDVVIYEGELTDIVKTKIDNTDYHFSVMTLTEFMQKIIPVEKRIPDIYGHVVTPSLAADSAIDNHIRNYIIISGGVYRKTYSKRETETLIVKSSYADVTVTKARNDGKKIIKSQDLLPELYNLSVREKKTDENTTPKPTTREFILELTTEPESADKCRKSKDDPSDTISCGCTLMFVIILAILIYALFN